MKAILSKNSEYALKIINIHLTIIGVTAFLVGAPFIFITKGIILLYLFFILFFGLAVFNINHLTNTKEDINFLYRSIYGRRVFFLLLPIVPLLPMFKDCYSSP